MLYNQRFSNIMEPEKVFENIETRMAKDNLKHKW